MSRHFPLAVAVFAVMCGRAAAQSFEWGVKAGIDWTTVSNFTGPVEGLESGFGRDIIGGLFGSVPIGERNALQPEFLFTRKGTVLTGTSPDLDARVTIRLEYLEVPILLRIAPGGLWNRRAYLLIGPSVGRRIQAQESIETPGITTETELSSSGLRGFDASVVVGGGVRLGRALAEGRYSHGLTSLGGEGASMRHRMIAIMGGFVF